MAIAAHHQTGINPNIVKIAVCPYYPQDATLHIFAEEYVLLYHISLTIKPHYSTK